MKIDPSRIERRSGGHGGWLALLLLAASAAGAQEPPSPASRPVTTASPSPTPFQDDVAEPASRTTPRGSMLGYLRACRAGDYAEAATYLNLRALPATEQGRGPELARQLKVVLDRQLWVSLERLSDEPEGNPDDDLPRGLDRVGTIPLGEGKVDILLGRLRADGDRVWVLTSATVARIPELWAEHGYGRLGEVLPEWMFETRWLEIELWQWCGLLLVMVAAWVVARIIGGVVLYVLLSLARGIGDDVAGRLKPLIATPVRLLIWLPTVWIGSVPLELTLRAREVIALLVEIGGILGAAWLLIRLVGLVADVIEQHLVARGMALATSLVPFARRVAQLLLMATALVVTLQNLGFQVTTLIAGLGIGGLAVALAAQKPLENFFGAVVLVTDRPISVGQFGKFGDQLGTVESIGLRSTRIRTLARTVVSIPNSEMASIRIESFAERDRCLLNPTLNLRYETTAEQLRWILIELKKLLLAHPRVLPEPARVRFVGFGASSLDVELFLYVDTSDFNEFQGIREDIFLRIMDVVERGGSGFAFPSQTVYFARDGGLDADRTRAAEVAIEEARQRTELSLPFPSAQQVESLRGTLPYPPEGSVQNVVAPPPEPAPPAAPEGEADATRKRRRWRR